MPSEPITIAVMGATGSGKTSFINLVSESGLRVGDGLESCTIRVETSLPFNLDGRMVVLIDTPGFDDTNRSDTDILRTVASFLSSKYEQGTKLAGVIYMHRIIDVKAGGISRRNFSLFRALCGDASLKNVAIVTNFWSQVQRDVGEKREAELRSKDIFFKPVLDKGASMLRHEGTLQSAQAILRHFINNAPVALQIQEEMVDRRLTVLQTGAAAQLDAEIREEARRHEEEIERARAEHRAAVAAQEEQARLEREREAQRHEPIPELTWASDAFAKDKIAADAGDGARKAAHSRGGSARGAATGCCGPGTREAPPPAREEDAAPGSCSGGRAEESG